MKLTIKWKYPNEIEPKIHVKVFYDVDPKSLCIANEALFFQKTDHGAMLRYNLDHIVRMEMEEE